MTEQQTRFVKALARYLVENEAMMSIRLSLGKEDATAWRELRLTVPLFGYYPGPEGREKAEKELTEFLGLS